MITSNSIIQRNAANQNYNAFSGEVTGLNGINIDTKNYGLLEINVFIQEEGSNVRMDVNRSGALSTDRNIPTLLDEDGTPLQFNRGVFPKSGMYKFYVDTLSFEGIRIRLNNTESGVNSEVSLSYTLYAEKFTALNLLEKKAGVRTVKNGSVSVYGFKSEDVYALVDLKRYSSGNPGDHFSFRTYDKSGAQAFPDVINAETGEVVSNSVGLVTIEEDISVYVDLFRYDANRLSIWVVKSGTEGDYGIVYKGTSFSVPKNNRENGGGGGNDQPVEAYPVFLEGKDFRFVKRSNFEDAWNGQFIDFTENDVTYSFTDSDAKTSTGASAIVAQEDSGIVNAHIVPYDPNLKNTRVATRYNMVLENGKTFHNHYEGGGITDWGETKFWEIKNTNRKLAVKTEAEVVSELYRFDPTLNDEIYAKKATKTEAGTTFIEFQDFARFNFLGGLCRTKKMVMWGTYTSSGSRIGVWMTTDGGANYVLVYDFITENITESVDINTSTFDAYSGGLTMNKVEMVYPSEADKEPATPFTYVDVPFSTISTGETTIVSTPSPHGLSNGDIVLFTGTAQDSNWNAITCDEFDGNGFKQNVYSVERINATSFRIKRYLGSYDNNLITRHVHSVNEAIGGNIISTGEMHPNGWTIYAEQIAKDASSVVNAFNFGLENLFRLNSSENGLQRACGFLMDNANDPNVIFNSDARFRALGTFNIAGRTTENLPTRSSYGIWKGKLSDIDDWSKFECVMDIPEPAIWMYREGNVIVSYYQLHGMAVSTDGGETFEYFANGKSHFNGVYDGRIAVNRGYIFEWKE